LFLLSCDVQWSDVIQNRAGLYYTIPDGMLANVTQDF
jgi:hypothetical protein